jgi:site-specific recombinase XerD
MLRLMFQPNEEHPMIDHDLCTLDALVEAYKQNQRRVRGLREPTLKSYEQVLRLFLRVSLGEDPLDPTSLAPADVVRFVESLQDRYAASSIKQMRTALRSLFRFLRMQGYCDEKLELAIPAVAHWRMANLPRCLNEQQLKQVLEAFNLRTPCGLRDRAMALCLSTLGLRPRELAELRLEDIDWCAGTLRLRTRKTRRGAMLPLPREAGHALVTYLRQGSGCGSRGSTCGGQCAAWGRLCIPPHGCQPFSGSRSFSQGGGRFPRPSMPRHDHDLRQA